MTYYMIAFIVIMAAGAVATFMVGFSKKNQHGNPRYDESTTRNISRLTLFYILMVVILLVMFVFLYRAF